MINGINTAGSKYASQQRANSSPGAMHAKRIERVVIAK